MDAVTLRDTPGGTSAEAPPSAFSSLRFADVCELFEAIREVNHTGHKGNIKKRTLLNRFFEHKTRIPDDQPRIGSFDLYRLMLPNIDKERGTYNLKEAALARCVGSALGLKRHESPDFLKLEGWRKSGSGDFARTVFELVAHHRPTNGVARHTVGDVNAALDRLCAARAADEKAAVMRALLDATDATQMFWITQVILKDVKIGYGETAILRHYHQDAVDLYNLCCDLRRVCETLAVRSERLKRQDLEPGALVKAMMASRAHGCAKAFEAMRDRPFVIETKFDGERIQVHRTDANSPLRYFTRNNNDFGPRGYDVLDRLFRARLKPSKTRCVFDGELVVWNTRDGVYAPFGYIKSLVNAIRDNRGGDERCVPEDPRGPAGGGARRFASRAPGEPAEKREEGLFEDGDGDGVDEGCLSEDVDVDVPDEASSACEPLRVKDLELVYVAFDVLYDEDRSVIDRPLRERHEILKSVFEPVNACDDVVQDDGGVFLGANETTRGRIVLNVPAAAVGDPPNPDCFVGATLRDVEDALWARVERREEGLVLKDLESRWVPGERDKKWVKLKPDYLPTEDLDVVVMGGFKGAGAVRGGKIAEYLVGIVEDPRRGAAGDGNVDAWDGALPRREARASSRAPARVVTFSKVGTGMSARVMERLRERLGPHMLPATRGPRRGAPPAYATTGAAGETPDVWIDSPANSVVLTVKADLRLVRTATFAAEYSLRFPRVTGVRWDKPWHECLSDAELERRVREDGGIAVAKGEEGAREGDDSVSGKRRRVEKKAEKRDDGSSRLPAHLAPSDVRHVAARDGALGALDVCFITAGAGAGAGAAEAARAAALKLELAGLLQSRGGAHSEARHPGTTHVVATRDARTSVRFEAATRDGGADVLAPEWLRACVAAGRVVEPRPKHRLFLSQTTVDAAEGRMDAFGDTHAEDLDAEDVDALLESDRVASAAAARAARGAPPDNAARGALDAPDASGIAAVFRGCAFAIVLAPERSRTSPERDDDDARLDAGFDEEARRYIARAFEAEEERTPSSSRDAAPSAAAAIARRDVAGDPAAHLPSPFGEAARLAAVLAASLRLRGASVFDRPESLGGDGFGTERASATHVLVVTPDGFARAPAARRVDGARFGAGARATWVNAAWVRARIDQGKPVVPSCPEPEPEGEQGRACEQR